MNSRSFDITAIRKDFPILNTEVHGKSLVYLDNAATTLKPKTVIDTVNKYYSAGTANVHRGLHYLSEQATTNFENVREKIRAFLNAEKTEEIVFTKGATEAINLVAYSYARKFLKKGDEIVISEMEHHSNIVPWQILRDTLGITLKIAPINDDGELIFEEFEKLLTPKTKLVGMVYISNSLGTINPVKKVIDAAHHAGAAVLIDGAQAVCHRRVDVRELDCDFFVFSGHKICGPTGIGVLYAKEHLLETMDPYQGGGDMIANVTFEKTTYNVLPHRFEAGTPHIAGVIGLGAALDYITSVGLKNIAAYEKELLEYGTQKLSEVKTIRLIGTAKEKTCVLSFLFEGIHAHDVGTLVDEEGVAIRTGHHCTQPVMQHFGIPATSRASLAFYNTKDDIDRLITALDKTRRIFN